MTAVKYKPIKLHENSVRYIDEVFNMYMERELTRDTVITNPIIHLYAEEDTYDENGELKGYRDSLFFKADIYDPKRKIKHFGTSLHDSVSFYNISPSQVNIFKDGSTMLTFFGDAEIGLLTSLCVYKHDKIN